MAKPPIDLQQQVTWKYPDRPVLLGWDIKARNYNTTIMTAFYIFGLLMMLMLSSFLYWIGLDKRTGEWFNWMSATGALAFIGFLFPFFYAWTHPHKTLVYRCTAQGFEAQSWNDIEIWKKVVLIVGVILAILILGVAIIFPPAILGLFIGPPLMAFFYFRMMSSDAYWRIQRDFSKISFTWDEPIEIIIDRGRSIIYFNYDFELKKRKGDKYFMTGMFSIFCPADKFDQYIRFFQEQMPTKIFKEGKAKVYPSSC